MPQGSVQVLSVCHICSVSLMMEKGLKGGMKNFRFSLFSREEMFDACEESARYCE